MSRIEDFLANAFSAADLLQSYIDKAADSLSDLEDEDLKPLEKEIKNTPADDPETVGAKAILLYLIKEEQEARKE